MEEVIKMYGLKTLGTDEAKRAFFHHQNQYLGESPEAVLIYISIHKRLNPDVTLEWMLQTRKITTVQSYQLALERWDTVKPITDEEYLDLMGYRIKLVA